MPHKKNFEEWADDFLNGNLNRQEEKEFEKALEADEQLETAFEEHKKLVGDLKKAGRRSALRNVIARVTQNELRSEKAGKQHHLLTWSAAAASIVIISVITSLFTAGYLNQKKQSNNFNALKREVDRIKYNQKVLVNDYNSKVKSSYASFGGTGFLIDPQGYLITNFHVVSASDSLFVNDINGNSYKAELVLASRDYDLALLKIEGLDNTLATVPVIDDNLKCSLGERLFTLGYPKDDIVYGEGYLSSRTGYMGDTSSFQISMALNPGNSGGPLFNAKGAVIGIVSGKQNEKEGVAFAVKSAYIKKLAEMAEKELETTINLKSAKSEKGKTASKTDIINKMENAVFQVRVFSSQ